MPKFVEMLKERQAFINGVIEDLSLDDVHSLLQVPTKYALLEAHHLYALRRGRGR